MLLRFDPFRDLDRLTEPPTWARPGAESVMPMDAVRRGDRVVVSFDLPGVDPDSIDLTVERNVLSVRAERHPETAEGDEILASERRHGSITRQLLLGDTLDGAGVEAGYDRGVLTVRIPVAAAAKPRKVSVSGGSGRSEAIETGTVKTSNGSEQS